MGIICEDGKGIDKNSLVCIVRDKDQLYAKKVRKDSIQGQEAQEAGTFEDDIIYKLDGQNAWQQDERDRESHLSLRHRNTSTRQHHE